MSYDKTLELKVFTFTPLTGLGLKIHPIMGHFDSIPIGGNLGMIIDMKEEPVPSPDREAQANRSYGQDLPLPISKAQTPGRRKDPCFPSRKSTIYVHVNPR